MPLKVNVPVPFLVKEVPATIPGYVKVPELTLIVPPPLPNVMPRFESRAKLPVVVKVPPAKVN